MAQEEQVSATVDRQKVEVLNDAYVWFLKGISLSTAAAGSTRFRRL